MKGVIVMNNKVKIILAGIVGVLVTIIVLVRNKVTEKNN